MCLWSTAGTPNLPGQAQPDTRLGPRSHSSLNPTPFDKIPAAPSGLANASRPHSKLCTRSPLFCGFCAGNPHPVTTSARNRQPFTFVHSHAAAQKSPGAFYWVLARERYPKRPARGRIALRRSGEGRERDVMFNSTVWRVQTRKRPPVGDLFRHFLLRPSVICKAQRSCARGCWCWPR
jgi:hypothetical protein